MILPQFMAKNAEAITNKWGTATPKLNSATHSKYNTDVRYRPSRL